jgi:recombination protein RecA
VKRTRIKPGGSYFSSPKTNIDFIGSGCALLDLALGGGWAEGRIANIVGDKSTGKSLLCIEACANFAMKYPRGEIRYRESEAAFDIPYAEALGMPVERVDFGDSLETVEDLFEDMTKVLARAKGPELYICDSLDALSDRSEMERSMDEGSYGTGKAKKMSELFRRLVRSLRDKKVTVIIVSQVRSAIGKSFGRATTRTGGRALDFYASQVLYLSQKGKIPQVIDGLTRTTGIKIRALVDKNKIGLAHRDVDFDIQFGFGVDDVWACLCYLKKVKQLGSLEAEWFAKGGVPDKMGKYFSAVDKLKPAEYREEVKMIHRVVADHWFDVERQLVPTRRKYAFGAE